MTLGSLSYPIINFIKNKNKNNEIILRESQANNRPPIKSISFTERFSDSPEDSTEYKISFFELEDKSLDVDEPVAIGIKHSLLKVSDVPDDCPFNLEKISPIAGFKFKDKIKFSDTHSFSFATNIVESFELDNQSIIHKWAFLFNQNQTKFDEKEANISTIDLPVNTQIISLENKVMSLTIVKSKYENEPKRKPNFTDLSVLSGFLKKDKQIYMVEGYSTKEGYAITVFKHDSRFIRHQAVAHYKLVQSNSNGIWKLYG